MHAVTLSRGIAPTFSFCKPFPTKVHGDFGHVLSNTISSITCRFHAIDDSAPKPKLYGPCNDTITQPPHLQSQTAPRVDTHAPRKRQGRKRGTRKEGRKKGRRKKEGSFRDFRFMSFCCVCIISCGGFRLISCWAVCFVNFLGL